MADHGYCTHCESIGNIDACESSLCLTRDESWYTKHLKAENEALKAKLNIMLTNQRINNDVEIGVAKVLNAMNQT